MPPSSCRAIFLFFGNFGQGAVGDQFCEMLFDAAGGVEIINFCRFRRGESRYL
jgi:hypothetical protein